MSQDKNGKEPANGVKASGDGEDILNAEDTVVLPEQALVDQESDVADTAIRKITAHVPQTPKAGADARRRVEDYLEMRRAARELNELEDFDAD